MVDKSRQVDMKGLELVADKFTGTVAATNVATKPTSVAAVATPDGTDAATTQTLANALKAKINELLTALKA